METCSGCGQQFDAITQFPNSELTLYPEQGQTPEIETFCPTCTPKLTTFVVSLKK